MKKSFLVLILLSIFNLFSESKYINDKNIFFIPSDININTLLSEIVSKDEYSIDSYQKGNYCTWYFTGDKTLQLENLKQIKCTEIRITQDFSNKITSIHFQLSIGDNDKMNVINSINNSFDSNMELKTFDSDRLSYNFNPTERLRGFITYNISDENKTINVGVFLN